MEQEFTQIVLLLAVAVAVIVAFQRLHVPTSLGYLLAGVIVGPFTIGPVIDSQPVNALAEFGIVFLLFTIGLNFSLPQIQALRNVLLGLGTGQIVLTTILVALVAWLAGVPPAAAFVIGAVFAQSSTTVISKQLAEQGEDMSRHGRLGTAMSVFQDVTAVPFLVIIPVLGGSPGVMQLGSALGLAMAKAVGAFVAVFIVGRWLLRPFFHLVTERRSAELFTLTVLLVSLTAAWVSRELGLSMAFGAFLAGMVLGETEFRHQVEASIRPFRDVGLGLFFIGIGMLIDPLAILDIWPWALAGTALLMVSKIVIVAQIVRLSGVDTLTAWRTGLLLAVGGEFGLLLLAIALPANVIDPDTAQIALTSVLFSIISAPLLIRYNQTIAKVFARQPPPADDFVAPRTDPGAVGQVLNHVIICGYGRIGQSVGHFLEQENLSYVALDLDSSRVKEAGYAGEPVYYGDATEPEMLDALGLESARLLVISHEDFAAARRTLEYVKAKRPDLPVLVRTRDESRVDELIAAGAREVIPETLEAGLMLASQVLYLLNVPISRIMRRVQEQRTSHYRFLREFFKGDDIAYSDDTRDGHRLRSIVLLDNSPAVGFALAKFDLTGVVITALVRAGKRSLRPAPDTRLQVGDTLVLFGSSDDLQRAERAVLG
jgi:CPA2 family monovalent cation:H+ antiporter-2